jgi:hypothetical protein
MYLAYPTQVFISHATTQAAGFPANALANIYVCAFLSYYSSA